MAGPVLGLAAGKRAARAEPPAPPAAEPREARFYEKLDGGKVRCGVCPRRCVVADGERGYCRVRENRKGTYYSLVYGYPVSIHLDPIEKKPFFHVYPGSKAFSLATVGCNFTCRFCQNWEISQASPADFRRPFVAPEAIAQAAAHAKAKTIAYTYNEPTVFCEYAIDCAKAGNALGIDSVVVSNGFIGAEAQKALLPHVKAVKVDLKSFSQAFYADMCGGVLQPVLDSLKRIRESGTWLEIVTLLIPTLNDGADEIKRMSDWIVKELGPDVPIHFTPYHPAYKVRNIAATPPAVLRRAREIALGQGCRYVYGGGLPGGASENTWCPKCATLVVDRYAYHVTDHGKGQCPKCGERIPGVWQ
ncbi:MAG: AmmeMemoRadiSam system radical SAM enzyme [Kiritimatiellae bacterium]|nr:AmmeMemoRadiSam system radical SAM enzyme [Kiritimatiellia bacterium]